MTRHAIPYAATPACRCPVQECGGIIPDPGCPDHGARLEPPMAWHDAESKRCRELSATPQPRYRCDRGHLLPAGFQPGPDPELWDDTCRCKPTP
jgi:hypothetical protein